MPSLRFGCLFAALLLIACPATAQEASIEAPSAVAPGAAFEVDWSGPDAATDFLTVVPRDADDAAFSAYVYTRQGNPARIEAPREPGDYEIRYLSGQPYRPLARRLLRVDGGQARVEAPAEVGAGSRFRVFWTGPNRALDFLTLVEAGAPERAYTETAYTRAGTPLTLTAPEQPGAYEIRYLSGQSYRPLASARVRVTARRATLDAPETAEARMLLQIGWEGPGAAEDRIAIVPAGSPEGTAATHVFTKWGNPARIEAPHEPGEYEIRYLAGRAGQTTASRPLRVTPGRRYGAVRVSGAVAQQREGLPEGAAVELILDASGSMLQRQEGERRIDLAKAALHRLTQEALPAGSPFALRVFGHRETGACRTDLEVPLQPLDPAAAAARIAGIEAMNLAKTPIAQSLEAVAEDLADVPGERIVILITDGEETCDGDPAAAIEALRRRHPGLRVTIVGFAIDDFGLKETFREWARLGGGAYFDARDAGALGLGMTDALQLPFELVDAEGRVVATGAVGGSAVEVPPGEYTVRVRSTPAREIPGVSVEAGATAEVRVD